MGIFGKRVSAEEYGTALATFLAHLSLEVESSFGPYEKDDIYINPIHNKEFQIFAYFMIRSAVSIYFENGMYKRIVGQIEDETSFIRDNKVAFNDGYKEYKSALNYDDKKKALMNFGNVLATRIGFKDDSLIVTHTVMIYQNYMEILMTNIGKDKRRII